MKTVLLISFLLAYHFGICQLFTPGLGIVDIDGNNYPTIIINNQEWMAENLKTSRYSDGNPILHISDSSLWTNATTGAWCNYNNDSDFDNPYGKFYNWYVLNDTHSICPINWHVPSDIEWQLLLNFLDPNANGGISTNTSGGLMKSTGTIQLGTGLWESPNAFATNGSGFTGHPAGQRNDNAEFVFMHSYAYYWSSDQVGQNNAIYFILFNSTSSALRSNHDKHFGKNVRCVKNQLNDLNEFIIPEDKQLIKITDLLGKEAALNPNEVYFFYYSDGSVQKRLVSE